ncbi:MAG: 1-(5-phosphoribosyl)-5-[(5-phosphoribosylamino)methylideneamino]imidazole-4-carboxamide isomerase [Planctomycetota bacterium]|jgi:phosphoribosylformimino-5-aminoimidazole carboxamide ribotide isomerase
MIVIPAVDIKGGVAVRLVQGRKNEESLRAGSPLDAAKKWAAYKPKRLHVVDLDGAFDGRPVNAAIVRDIIGALAEPGVPVEIGGGIRTRDDAAMYLEAGAARVILGTRAAEDQAFVMDLAREFPGRVNLGLDCSRGLVAVKGWVEATDLTALELLSRLEGAPLGEVIYTDISTDGMLSGPNIDAARELARRSPYPVTASGGVSSLDDLVRLADEGVFFGAIVGRAIYTGAVDLAEAIARGEGR